MHITNDHREPHTTIGTYKLAGGQILFFRGKNLLERLKQVPGLASATIFRSYDRCSIVVYAQWDSRNAAELGAGSQRYQSCFASIATITLPATVCEIPFVDDARPVTDDMNAMVLDPKKDNHVTLICSFKVQPGRREEFISLLERDHTFLREFPGFVSVAFHKAVASEDVAIELLQFQSALKLRAVSQTPRGRLILRQSAALLNCRRTSIASAAALGGLHEPAAESLDRAQALRLSGFLSDVC